MFGLFGNKFKSQEDELAKWLAHPNEFGVSPKSIKHIQAYSCNLVHYGVTSIHLIGYEMPNGQRGRGFVNPITWSFLGDDAQKISNDDLIVAYCGWAFLFPGLQSGSIKTQFDSQGEEERYILSLQSKGLSEIDISEKYQIGTSYLFGFKAIYNGGPVKGAGNTESEVGYPSSHPRFGLPAIYFLLGAQMLK